METVADWEGASAGPEAWAGGGCGRAACARDSACYRPLQCGEPVTCSLSTWEMGSFRKWPLLSPHVMELSGLEGLVPVLRPLKCGCLWPQKRSGVTNLPSSAASDPQLSGAQGCLQDLAQG